MLSPPFNHVSLLRFTGLFTYACSGMPLLACEVFLEPRDDVSVLFHGTYGSQEVGQQLMSGVHRRVSLLAKVLCSHAFVLDTFLAQSGLPNQPWLAERPRPAPGLQSRAAGAH